MKTPQKDIDSALEIESKYASRFSELYSECLNNLPMSERVTEQEIRDGCILTHYIFMLCIQSKIGDCSESCTK